MLAREFEPSRIGARLREERQRQGITLRELARRVGVSPSLISQIELDRVNPSVSTLWSVVTALGMTMSEVFGDAPSASEPTGISREADRRVTSPDARRVINLASGVRWERLTPHNDPDIEFLYVVYPVGGESSPEHALVTHGGREYGYVSSGVLGVQVAFDEYVLGPGASIVFDSSEPHRLWTIGDEPVHAIWVVIGRVGDPRSEASPTLRAVD
jgi:transcriptional regulator with XRE-family HTH domain